MSSVAVRIVVLTGALEVVTGSASHASSSSSSSPAASVVVTEAEEIVVEASESSPEDEAVGALPYTVVRAVVVEKVCEVVRVEVESVEATIGLLTRVVNGVAELEACLVEVAAFVDDALSAADEDEPDEPELPHPVTGLSPGRASMVPEMVSGTRLAMLQLVDASFKPPMSPGHLSIPLSPASQLSIIC